MQISYILEVFLWLTLFGYLLHLGYILVSNHHYREWWDATFRHRGDTLRHIRATVEHWNRLRTGVGTPTEPGERWLITLDFEQFNLVVWRYLQEHVTRENWQMDALPLLRSLTERMEFTEPDNVENGDQIYVRHPDPHSPITGWTEISRQIPLPARVGEELELLPYVEHVENVGHTHELNNTPQHG